MDSEQGLSKGDKIANAVIIHFGQKARVQDDLRLCGIGGGAKEDKMYTLSASFYLYRPILKDEARELIIKTSNEFLKEINDDEKLRPYLKNVPFTIKNVEVRIFFSNRDRYEIYDPYISVVTCINEKIHYLTDHPEEEFKHILDDYETYDEAVSILANNPAKESK